MQPSYEVPGQRKIGEQGHESSKIWGGQFIVSYKKIQMARIIIKVSLISNCLLINYGSQNAC